jgi:hypothetical protein
VEDRAHRLEVLLPYALRDRFRSFIDYVRDRLIDVAKEEKVEGPDRSRREEIEIIFLLRFLYGQLAIGVENYEGTLSYLRSKNVAGYQFGGTEFTQGSGFTQRWRSVVLAFGDLLRDDRLNRLVTDSLSVDTVLRELIGANNDQSHAGQ